MSEVNDWWGTLSIHSLTHLFINQMKVSLFQILGSALKEGGVTHGEGNGGVLYSSLAGARILLKKLCR